MATFSGQHTESRSLSLSPEAAAAAWADLDRQARCHPELASAEVLGTGRVRMRLKEMKHGPSAFQGDYTLQFTVEGGVVRWRTLPGGRPVVEGEARFLPSPGGCTLHFRESASVEMDLGALAARVLRPMVGAMMSRGMHGFVERMVAELG